MNSPRIWAVGKWLWGIFVILFAMLFAYDNANGIEDGIKRLDLFLISEAVLLIIAGKLSLIVTMWAASRQYAIFLGWCDTYCMYNLTQLAKYIPGSIWQFVGRIAMLKARQANSVSIRDSLIAEHAWVIGSALTFSVLLGFLIHAELSNSWLRWFQPKWHWAIFALVPVLLLPVILARLGWQAKSVGYWLYGLLPPLFVLPFLILVWLSFGAALWVTLAPFTTGSPSLSYVVAAYCFAYVVGFVVPFAPAGIGVREALIVLALSPYVGVEFGFFLAAFNRLIYFLAEVVLASPCVISRMAIK